MLIVKCLHIIAFVSWFAGLLYLPRLFVYHAEGTKEVGQTLAVMEARLYWRIMLPAMLLTLFFGLMLLGYQGFSGHWLSVKLLLVAVLIGFHISLLFYMKQLTTEQHPSGRFFRLYNEVPTLILIVIVFLAVLKPF